MQKEDITELLEQKFDRIYVIHLLDYKDRWPIFLKEIERVGIDKCRNLEYFYDVKSPFDYPMFKDLVQFQYNNDLIGLKKLALNHYKIYKQSLLLGYKRILVLEDDIRFLKNIDNIYKSFANIPENSDITLMDYNTSGIIVLNDEFKFAKDVFDKAEFGEYFTGDYRNISSTSCYTVSVNGMQYLIDSMEKLLESPIQAVNHNNNSTYIANFMPPEFFVQKFNADDRKLLYRESNDNVVFSLLLKNICIQQSMNVINTHEVENEHRNLATVPAMYAFIDQDLYNIHDTDVNILCKENVESVR